MALLGDFHWCLLDDFIDGGLCLLYLDFRVGRTMEQQHGWWLLGLTNTDSCWSNRINPGGIGEREKHNWWNALTYAIMDRFNTLASAWLNAYIDKSRDWLREQPTDSWQKVEIKKESRLEALCKRNVESERWNNLWFLNRCVLTLIHNSRIIRNRQWINKPPKA